MAIKQHPRKKWEVSIMEIHEGERIRYKVTRRVPEFGVAETRFFDNKEEALALFNEWLN